MKPWEIENQDEKETRRNVRKSLLAITGQRKSRDEGKLQSKNERKIVLFGENSYKRDKKIFEKNGPATENPRKMRKSLPLLSG